MAWSVLYPVGTDPNNPPTHYAKAESGPRIGFGIHGRRSKAKRRRDKQQYERNRVARSTFNLQHGKELPANRILAYHAALDGMSKGTYSHGE